ncbi:hypothetical protein BDV96DRAFT_654149 [Lophiotrema nucula]|uniref:Zn(2)-C6 fungal-type domain-containing protein n=1 Tax=Lophiotrema nucula TaxID=690887 RepID=A0A6A5YII8_9PLEO|nr:hypothetical protein BDV96DRAFT_654149 [Lophiotrema nucula]
MVGVGGRSKACDQCRRRRIKCDLDQPACKKCVKAGLKCGGSGAITFVFHDSGKISHSTRTDRTTSLEIIPYETEAKVSNATGPFITLYPTLLVPPNDLFLNFARARLLKGPDSEDIISPEPDNSLTDASFLALATTYFGAEHKDNSVVQRGLRRYSHAIEQINSALGDPIRCLSLDLLGAIVTMSLHEYLMSQRDLGWVHHARGFEKLMQVRGPEAFVTLPALMLMERTRVSIIFAALVTRQQTIIARPEWKTIPWALFPDRKTPMQRLLDIFADCPALLFTQTGLKKGSSGERNHDKYQNLLQATENLLEGLDHFQDGWKSTHQESIWEVASPETTPFTLDEEENLVPFWTSVLHYKSLDDANVVMLGSAIRIFLLLIYLDSTPSREWGITESVSAQLIQAGTTICRTVDYQLQETRKGASNHLLIWPLKMAYDALGRENPLLGEWLGNHLDNIANGLAGILGTEAEPLSKLHQASGNNNATCPV